MQEVLIFFPERPCTECGRMTTTGIVTSELHPNFLPLCPWHGLLEAPGKHPSARERQKEYASVARFALAIHQGYGCVRVIRRVSPSLVPGWRTPEARDLTRYHFPDRAWYVTLFRSGSRQRSGWVLWSYERLAFSWVRERKGGSRQ